MVLIGLCFVILPTALIMLVSFGQQMLCMVIKSVGVLLLLSGACISLAIAICVDQCFCCYAMWMLDLCCCACAMCTMPTNVNMFTCDSF